MLDNKTCEIIKHIVNYCDQIQEAIDEFHLSEEKITQSHPCRNSVAMPLMQIGELVKKLPIDFKDEYSNIPWRDITGARDYYAHGYQTMDPKMIWESAVHDAPYLKKFCNQILIENNYYKDESLNPSNKKIIKKRINKKNSELSR